MRTGQCCALDSPVELVRCHVCPDHGDPVQDSYVKRLREKGKMDFNCPCGGTVSLAEPKERLHFRSKVEVMDKSADGQRDFDAFVMSARGETSTKSFQDWAGGEQVTLAVVSTDVVGSTALGEEIRVEAPGFNAKAQRRGDAKQGLGLNSFPPAHPIPGNTVLPSAFSFLRLRVLASLR